MSVLRRSALPLLISAGVCACGAPADKAPPSTVVIGAVLDLTGNQGNAKWTPLLQLAQDDVNSGLAASGANVRMQVKIADANTNATVALPRAQELVAGGAKALITGTSSEHVAVNAINYDVDPTKHLDVPLMGANTSSPLFNNAAAADPADRNELHWSFRTVMSSLPEATGLAQLMVGRGDHGDLDQDGQMKVSIVADNSNADKALEDAIGAAVLQLRPDAIVEKLLIDSTIDVTSFDWNAEAQKLTDNKNENTGAMDGLPDFTIEVSFASIARALVGAYVASNQTIPLLHPHTFRVQSVSSLIASFGMGVVGQEGISHVILENDASGAVFSKEWTAANAGVPPVLFDASTYDAAVTLMLATTVATRGMPDASKVTGAEIRDALSKINDPNGTVVRVGPSEMAKAATLIIAGTPINYEGASGPCDFDAIGNVTDKLERYVLQQPGFAGYEQYDCPADPACPLIH